METEKNEHGADGYNKGNNEKAFSVPLSTPSLSNTDTNSSVIWRFIQGSR